MAVVVGLSEHQDDWGLENGDRIEVIGFVRNSWQLQAVYRDDEGIVRELPVWAIRMDPSTVKVDLPAPALAGEVGV